MKSAFDYLNSWPLQSALLLACCLLLPMHHAKASDSGSEVPIPSLFFKKEFSKLVSREFPVTATGTVSLTNKYGKVDVKTWNKNQVKIEVTILVNAKTESDAKAVFERITIAFSETDQLARAETIIESQHWSWWNWGIWLFGGSSSDFKINYLVHMPQTGSLELSNKYGDAYVAALEGKASVAVQYGNFRLEGVGSNLQVDLAYGNGTIVKAGDARAEVSYSKINFDEVEYLNATTRYSTIDVDKAGRIVSNSRYDNYYIHEINSLQCEGQFGDFHVNRAGHVSAVGRYTDFHLEKFRKGGSFDTNYGDVRIDELQAGFPSLSLTGNYSDIRIGLAAGTAYLLDLSGNFLDADYPSGMQVVLEREKSTSLELKGHEGGEPSRGVITTRLNYGKLKLRKNEN
jgi:hypothetical protein